MWTSRRFRSCDLPILTAVLFVGLFPVVHAQTPLVHAHSELPGQFVGHSLANQDTPTRPEPIDLFATNEPKQEVGDLTGTRQKKADVFLASLSVPNLTCVTPSAGAATTYPSVRVFGFLQADGIWFGQDQQSQAALGNIQDVVDFRRSRLGARGDLAENIGFYLQYDFSLGGRPTFVDLGADLRDFGGIETLSVGRFRMPQGMDALTNIPVIVFMERATPTSLVPFRQTGLQASGNFLDTDATYAGAVYKYPSDPFGGSAGDDGYGAAGRLTMVLYDDDSDEILVHGGLSMSYNGSNGTPYQYRAIPGVGATFGDFDDPVPVIPPFVNTGPINAHYSNVVGYEAAMQMGPVLVQSEALIAYLDQIGGPALRFPGFTIHAAWVLTGETHPYDRRHGVFGGVPVENNWGQCGCGAWEVAARYSLLDLTDANIIGGRLQDVTLGVNWYLNSHTRVQFNYDHSKVDQVAGPSFETDIAAVRFQYDF